MTASLVLPQYALTLVSVIAAYKCLDDHVIPDLPDIPDWLDNILDDPFVIGGLFYLDVLSISLGLATTILPLALATFGILCFGKTLQEEVEDIFEDIFDELHSLGR